MLTSTTTAMCDCVSLGRPVRDNDCSYSISTHTPSREKKIPIPLTKIFMLLSCNRRSDSEYTTANTGFKCSTLKNI